MATDEQIVIELTEQLKDLNVYAVKAILQLIASLLNMPI